MKKRWICLLMVLMLFSISSCASQKEVSLLSANDPVTVTFWHYYGNYVQTQLQDIIDEFNETIGKENGVIVEAVSKTNVVELENDLTASAQGVVYADPMPDMFLAYADKILELQKLGIIADLNDTFSEEDKALIIDSFMEAGVIDGQQSVLPIVKSTEMIFMNTTYFEPFATATNKTYDDLLTWEGVLETAKTYYEYTDALTPDIQNDGKALFGLDSVQNYIVVGSMQLGTDIFDAENETAVLSQSALEAVFKLYVEAMSFGYFDSVAQYRSDDVRSGQIISYAGSSASFAYFPDWVENNNEKDPIEWEALSYPAFADGETYVLSQGAGVAIAKTGDQRQEASSLFLKYFLQESVDFALTSAYVPVTKEFLTNVDETLAAFEKQELEANEISAYQIVIDQIENDELYQSAAFDGSYYIRTELSDTFEQVAQLSEEFVNEQRGLGKSDEEILLLLDLDTLFDETMSTITEKLTSKGIGYDYQQSNP